MKSVILITLITMLSLLVYAENSTSFYRNNEWHTVVPTKDWGDIWTPGNIRGSLVVCVAKGSNTKCKSYVTPAGENDWMIRCQGCNTCYTTYLNLASSDAKAKQYWNHWTSHGYECTWLTTQEGGWVSQKYHEYW